MFNSELKDLSLSRSVLSAKKSISSSGKSIAASTKTLIAIIRSTKSRILDENSPCKERTADFAA